MKKSAVLIILFFLMLSNVYAEGIEFSGGIEFEITETIFTSHNVETRGKIYNRTDAPVSFTIKGDLMKWRGVTVASEVIQVTAQPGVSSFTIRNAASYNFDLDSYSLNISASGSGGKAVMLLKNKAISGLPKMDFKQMNFNNRKHPRLMIDGEEGWDILRGKIPGSEEGSFFTNYSSKENEAFAIADISEGYPDAKKMLRGIKLTNNRNAVLCHDEYELYDAHNITWGILTDSESIIRLLYENRNNGEQMINYGPIISKLRLFTLSYNYIDSIYVYSEKSDVVITDFSVQKINYFEDNSLFSVYSENKHKNMMLFSRKRGRLF